MKEIQCPNCNSKEMTLVKSSMLNDELKYTYLCRECKQPFIVNIEINDKEEENPKR